MSVTSPLFAQNPITGPIENLLGDGLVLIHETTGLTWAWSIIALTAVVRLAIMPITIKQTRSMLAMTRLQPYVKQLQAKYKDDRQELNLKMMEFYRDNKVNPLASCFPLLLQLPVFLALFFELRNWSEKAPAGDLSFLFGFVDDITFHINDSGLAGWVLLLFYVASQMFASKVMATSPDPRQRMLMIFLPVAFVPFIVNFPIGLMLYWITTNLWTLAQHTVVLHLTDTTREVVLPEDNRGKKKTVMPKADKAAAKAKNSGSNNDSPVQVQQQARRNKRRR